MFRRFLGCEAGATAIEYALIAALLFGAILAAFNTLSQAILATFTWLGDAIANRPNP